MKTTGRHRLNRGGHRQADVLTDAGIHISMDGKGRWMDNVFIERLWRSLKYEQVYLAEYATASDARAGIGWWIDVYNARRPHSSLVDRTPNEAYTVGATPGPGRCPACRSRIRHQAAAGSWTMPRQWEIQRTWLNSARAAVRSPAKPNGV